MSALCQGPCLCKTSGEMKDKILHCIQCESSFVFSVDEQNRYRTSGFDEPKRCPNCRKKRFKVVEAPERRRNHKEKRKHRSRKNGFDDYEE